MKPVLLWTDLVVLLLVAVALLYVRHVRRTPHLAATWRQAFVRPVGSAAATVLCLFAAVGLLDCLHYRVAVAGSPAEQRQWSPETLSALDALLRPLRDHHETTYSRPLALYAYEKQTAVLGEGQFERRYPRLAHAGTSLGAAPEDYGGEWARDVATRVAVGLAGALAAISVLVLASAWLLARTLSPTPPPRGSAGEGSAASTPLPRAGEGPGVRAALAKIARGQTRMPIRTVLATLGIALLLAGPITALALDYHVFGTDRIGNDLLYRVLKSIRTALVIGTMTTLVTLPLSVGLGLLAGYARGWVDEVVQYLYTVINSVPYVLLIAAAILLLVVFIDSHPDAFPTSAERTDARLFFLCVILGLSSWTELCRLVRGEVLKLRELEFVQAAQAFGVRPARILRVHLLPNVMHVVLINVVIRFSELVLAEATLSYVGVGVDPAMASFGTLINTARLELGRDPVIWWSLAAAFVFLFALVLAANYFADAVRDAFDPRLSRAAVR